MQVLPATLRVHSVGVPKLGECPRFGGPVWLGWGGGRKIQPSFGGLIFRSDENPRFRP